MEPDTHNWILDYLGQVLGSCVALVGGAIEYLRRKLEKLTATAVTREELVSLLTAERALNETKHKENITALNNLSQRIDRVLERL